MSNPSAPLDIALVGSTSLQHPNCDPAINLRAAGVAAKLSAYERERTPEALAALPLIDGSHLVLFRTLPLTANGRRYVLTQTGVARAQNAVMVACHSFTDERGVEHTATDHGGLTQIARGYVLATDEWLDHITDLYGQKAITEIAAVIVVRAEVGPAAVAPFGLPPGLMLAL